MEDSWEAVFCVNIVLSVLKKVVKIIVTSFVHLAILILSMYVLLMLDEDKSALNITLIKRYNKVFNKI